MLLIPPCLPSILLWSKCETVVVSTQVMWDVGLLVFQGEWTQAQVRLLTWTTPAAIEGVWPLMIRVATQIFSYQWSALSKPCITPKSSHWCPNDCFPSNLPAKEKQHSPSSSHHIVLCCNFYPGNVRLMGPRLDNSSSGHFVVILTWMDSISVKMMDNAVIFFKGVILNSVYLKLWTLKSSWYKLITKKFTASLNFCQY